MTFTEEIKKYIAENEEAIYSFLRDLCLIPAPSGHEEARAEYCRKWFEDNGAKGVYIDEALNVIFPLNCEGSSEITVFVAHTDTVFPDTEPMPYSDDGEIIRCPGVGDDTANLTVMMFMAKYFVEKNLTPEGGILFVANSCEEGLGNLKGTRRIFADYEGRIKQFISFDSNLDHICNCCVGSHRYEVEDKTVGGHSYQAFGNPNAINELCGIVRKIYEIEVPTREGARTTFNVGGISGGTSVNTIAQSAKMLCEYRSSNYECLAIMKENFANIFESARREGVEVNVKVIGERPCAAGVDENKIDELVNIGSDIITEVTGMEVTLRSASTDCNIPLSLGIPAICIGVITSGGSHTREEWLKKKYLIPGVEVAVKVGVALTNAK